jgi:hypothetical protein
VPCTFVFILYTISPLAPCALRLAPFIYLSIISLAP